MLPSQAGRFEGRESREDNKVVMEYLNQTLWKKHFSFKIQQVDDSASCCLSLEEEDRHFGAERGA